MSGQLKNCYSTVYNGVYQALRDSLAKPLSLLLLGIFLSTHAIAAYSELRDTQQPRQTLKKAELSDYTPATQQSEATNWQKLRGDRAGAASHETKRLEARSHHPHVALVLPSRASIRQFFTSYSNLSSILLCEAPFSSRPPPAASSPQG